jgi:class 3 adenylate cyclase
MFELLVPGKSNGALRRIALNGERCVLGTDAGCDVVLDDDGKIARRHAVIHLDGSKPTLVDLESQHGTFRNGEKISKATLGHLDKIGLGDATLVFQNPGHELSPTEIAEKVQVADFMVDTENFYSARPHAILPSEDTSEDTQADTDGVLAYVAEKIGVHTSLDDLLKLVMQVLFEILPADRGFIMVYDGERRALVPRAARSRNPKPNEQLAYSRTLLTRVQDGHEALLIQDASFHPELADAASIRVHRLRSVMCVPFYRGDHFLGVLQLDTSGSGQSFSIKDLHLVSCIGHLIAIAVENTLLLERLQKEAETREQMSTILGRRLLDALVSGKIKLGEDAQTADLAILFADIRGFSRLSRDMTPQEIHAVVNDVFDELSDCIFEYEGIITQFAGDEIKAIFGGPWSTESGEASAVSALRAALRLQEVLKTWNERRPEDAPQIQMGVGLNFGPLAIGRVGAAKRGDFSFQGDAANTAARVCAHAEAGEILITDAMAKTLVRHLELSQPHLDYIEAPRKFVLRRRDAFEAKNIGEVSIWAATVDRRLLAR